MDRTSVCTWLVLIAVLGTILSLSWGPIFDSIVQKELQLSPTSRSYAMWKDTPIPITLDFYFFNWTNPDDLLEDGFKPDLVQLGPYRFREVHEKINVTWNDNNTISFRQAKKWYFDPEHSNGTLQDNVTTLNPVSLSATSVTRFRGVFSTIPLSSALRMTGQKVWVSKTIGELLFEGYSDPILTLAVKMPHLAKTSVPTDKFGWFYKRNGSADFEGTFNMETGAQDISKLGKLSNWNFDSRTSFYDAECGMVNGSAGELFPPGQKREVPLEMFSSDLCRSITFDYEEDTEVQGIAGYKYTLGKRLMDNGTLDPANWCNCAGDCVPSGVLNVTSCRHGAPAFVSYPHFLDADPYYREAVLGMNPDPRRHRFYLTVEPTTGIPLDVAARLQINLLLQSSDNIAMYDDVPTIFFPMMWFEERATMSEELAAELKLLLMMPVLGLSITLGITLFGIVLACCGIVPRLFTNERWTIPRLSKTKKQSDKNPQVVYTKEQIRPLMTQPEAVPVDGTLLGKPAVL